MEYERYLNSAKEEAFMDYYSQIAKGYYELHSREQLKKMSIIKRILKVSKSTRMLDVGCGTGLSSKFDCFVAGIDPSMGLLRCNKNANRVNGAAESLPFKDKSFDQVISVTSMHNFENIGKSISEIKRVGKRNFVLSILKKSAKFALIHDLIKENFRINGIVEEDKDMIFFCSL